MPSEACSPAHITDLFPQTNLERFFFNETLSIWKYMSYQSWKRNKSSFQQGMPHAYQPTITGKIMQYKSRLFSTVADRRQGKCPVAELPSTSPHADCAFICPTPLTTSYTHYGNALHPHSKWRLTRVVPVFEFINVFICTKWFSNTIYFSKDNTIFSALIWYYYSWYNWYV